MHWFHSILIISIASFSSLTKTIISCISGHIDIYMIMLCLALTMQNSCQGGKHSARPKGECTSHHFLLSMQYTHLYYSCTRRAQLVEQELPTIPEHLNSPPTFSGVCVTRSLVLCVCFVDHCLSFCTFSFGHCVVCSSSIYWFWLLPFGIFKLFTLFCNW
jgi:hypothetical protein